MNGINLLKDYIKDQKEIVIFCGAGTSVELGLPNWKDLTKAIVTEISNQYGVAGIQLMIPPMEEGMIPILDVLELVSTNTYRKSILDMLKSHIEIETQQFSLHNAICGLSEKIVTTNYDLAFETATNAEGYDYNILKIFIQNSIATQSPIDILFKLGLIKEAYTLIPHNHSDKSYFDYEVELANNKLNLEEVLSHIDLLYKKESLEMTQMVYLKSKVTSVTNDEIKKLVISNPYTRGLIFLMRAKNEDDVALKGELFLKAKQNLFHIKYHYVECLVEYIKFLKLNGKNSDITSNISEAVNVAKKYNFRLLHYKLLKLENNNHLKAFDENYLPLPINKEGLKKLLNDHLQKNSDYFKKQLVKTKRNVAALNEDFS